MGNDKSNNLAVSIICGALTIFGIVISFISLLDVKNSITMINDIIDLVLSALIWYYALYGYKKPNGNSLRYIILLFAVPFLISVYSRALHEAAWQAVNRAVTIGLLCYIAGRLDRVKQNIILMSIVTALILSSKIVKLVHGSATISIFSSLIIWVDICVAYFLRYKEHKSAGRKSNTD